jgi:hypothetical protein
MVTTTMPAPAGTKAWREHDRDDPVMALAPGLWPGNCWVAHVISLAEA